MGEDIRESFKTHPQAHIIISDLEKLIGDDWTYGLDGRYVTIGNCSYKPYEVMALCDGIRYANKRTIARLSDLVGAA